MTDHIDPQAALDKATYSVLGATETVRTTTESIADAIRESRRPGGVLDQLTQFTRDAPLRSLAVAFVVGAIVARRW